MIELLFGVAWMFSPMIALVPFFSGYGDMQYGLNKAVKERGIKIMITSGVFILFWLFVTPLALIP